MQIGVVLTLRASVKFTNVRLSSVYDVGWWTFAVSDDDDDGDDILQDAPQYGRVLVELLLPESPDEHNVYHKYLEEEGGKKGSAAERLTKIAELVRRVQHNQTYDVGDAFSAYMRQKYKRHWNDKLSRQVLRHFANVDARALVDPTLNIVQERANAVNIVYGDAVVHIGAGLRCHLPKSVEEKYGELRFVADTPLYSLYKNAQDNGVVVFKTSVYNARSLVYDRPLRKDVEQVQVHRTEETFARLVGVNEEVHVCLATISKFSRTLEETLSVLSNADPNRRRVILRTLGALNSFNSVLTHGSLTLSKVLVGRDGSIMFMDFSRAQLKPLHNDEGFDVTLFGPGTIVPTAYNEQWDVFSLMMRLLIVSPSEETVREIRRLSIGHQVLFDTKSGRISLTFRASNAPTLLIDIEDGQLTVHREDPQAVRVEYRDRQLRLASYEFTRRGVKLGALLGNGAYGVVYSVDDERVVKFTTIDVTNEVEMQRRAAAEDLAPQIYDVFTTRILGDNDFQLTHMHAIIMQKMQSTLQQAIMRVAITGMQQLMTVVTMAFAAIRRLNAAHIYHKDIHLGNVMVNVDDGNVDVRVIDFGFALYDEEGSADEALQLHIGLNDWVNVMPDFTDEQRRQQLELFHFLKTVK